MVKFIADIGVNHNGDLDLAVKLAKAARDAGADFVKLQLRTVEDCYEPWELEKPYDSPFGTTVGDKVRKRELSWHQLQRFDVMCKEEKIAWTASCFDLKSMDTLRKFDVPFLKIPSCMAIYPEYLRRASKRFEKIVLSLGLVDDRDIKSTMRQVKNHPANKNEIVLMHATALYPCPQNRTRIGRITKLREFIGDECVPSLGCEAVGYSGHCELDYAIPVTCAAVALGATYIEHHFMLEEQCGKYCADAAVALSTHRFEAMVNAAKMAEGVRYYSPGPQVRGDEKTPIRKFIYRNENS